MSSSSNAFFASAPAPATAASTSSAPPVPGAITKWDAPSLAKISNQVTTMRDEMKTLSELRASTLRDANVKALALAELQADIAFAESHGRTKITGILKNVERGMVSTLKQMEDKYNQLGVSLAERAAMPCPCCNAKITTPEDEDAF